MLKYDVNKHKIDIQVLFEHFKSCIYIQKELKVIY